MRWLGNKTALLDEILSVARSAGYRGGTVCDLFAGSGSVGRFFRSQGSRVISTDLMSCSLVFQKAYLETIEAPTFSGIEDLWGGLEPLDLSRLSVLDEGQRSEWIPFLQLANYLENHLPPQQGFLFRQFSPEGDAGRIYLTGENAARVDAILEAIRNWRVSGVVTDQEVWILLASCIDAVDRVANISGTYGAFLKKLQKSAERPLELRSPAIVPGPPGAAHNEDALEWINGVECELLYIDPPYNQRQYPANYHLPEILSLLPFEDSDQKIEETLYGKTGLIPWKEKASPLCSRRGDECLRAMQKLIEGSNANIIVFSYSEEGILQREQLEKLLGDWSDSGTGANLNLVEIPYRRFRSDSEEGSSQTPGGRTFKPAPGRSMDEVQEWLFVATRKSNIERVRNES